MILRSFASRLTAIHALLTAIAVIGGLGALTMLASHVRRDAVFATVTAQADRLLARGAPEDFETAMRARIVGHRKALDDECGVAEGQWVYMLRRTGGGTMTSVVLAWPEGSGDSVRLPVPAAMSCGNGELEIYGVVRSFLGGDFLVGQVMRPGAGLWPLAASIGAAVIVVACLLAIGIGHLFGRTYTARIRRINAVLDHVEKSGFKIRVRSERTGSAELDELADHIDAMIARTGELTGNLSRLALHIAHDLRSPLEVVQRNLRRLHDQLGSRSDRQLVDEARVRLVTLMSRCEQLLAIVRIETAAQDTFGQVLLREQIEMLVEDMFLDASLGVGIGISVDAPDEIIVTGIEEMIQRTLTNVFQNAIKFGTKGTMIWVRLYLDGKMARIEIDNDGPTVAEDRLEVIFNPNVATSVNKGGGYGLGLPFVRATARRHGGDAFALRRPEGMRIVILLPDGALAPSAC